MSITPVPNRAVPWLMLISRIILFLVFQGLISLIFLLFGVEHAWIEASGWWMFMAIATNLVCIYFLTRVFKAEGKRFLDLFKFSKTTRGRDLLWLAGSSVIGGPLMVAPMGNLAVLIFGDSITPITMMFRPLPVWALALGLLFPLTITLAELPTYFGYVMPRLGDQLKNGWAAWLITSVFLAAQHCFLPLILDRRFILWRFGMFLPFALFSGLMLKLRPQLLPYLVIFHGLLDIATWSTYFML